MLKQQASQPKSFLSGLSPRERGYIVNTPRLDTHVCTIDDLTKGGSLWEKLRYKDILEGYLYLMDEIDSYTVNNLMLEISEIKRIRPLEVTLYICSSGGGAYHALAIYDALRWLSSSGVAITTIALGMAESAAAMIVLQAGDTRQCTEHTRFLLHEPRRWVFSATERASDIKDEAEEMQRITQTIIDILAKRCNQKEDDIERLISRREVWMSSEQALAWGLVDEVI